MRWDILWFALLGIVIGLIVGCEPAGAYDPPAWFARGGSVDYGNGTIYRFFDTKQNNTCYILRDGRGVSIDCVDGRMPE